MLRRIQRPRQSQPPPEAAWPDYQSPLARSWRQSSAGIWIPGAPNAITRKPWVSGGSGAEPTVAGTSAGLGIYTSGKWVQTDLPSASFSALTWTAVICPDAAPSSTGFNAFFQTGQTTFNWNHASTSYQGAFTLYNSGGYPTCKFTGGFTAGKTEVVGGTYDGTTLVVYRAGVFENSQTAANGLSGVTLNSLQLLGGTGGTVAWAGSMPFFLWDTGRAYSAAEMAALHANVWQVFAPRRIWVPVSAGGGSVSLIVADATHAHTADGLVLTSSTALSVADATHAHAADAITLVVGSVLAIAEASHAHTADSLTLTAASALAVADATHGHAADNITLSVAGATSLTVADALHSHAADALALTSAHALIVADATHGHTVDGLTLTAASVLAIQEALHAHAADNITLDASGAVNLLLADGLHAHTADGVALTVAAWLTVADALHGHAADNVVLTFGGAVVEPLARYTITAKRRRLEIRA